MITLMTEEDFGGVVNRVKELEKKVNGLMCPRCEGAGEIEESLGPHSSFMKCDVCRGTGLGKWLETKLKNNEQARKGYE